MTMADLPDRELLSQSAARQLLERAGQIDSESTSVDTLRAAAREAGISEAAFDAALLEMRGNVTTQSPPNVPRSRKGMLIGLGAGILLMAGLMASFVIPRAAGSARSVQSTETLVRCLPMTTAGEIARSTLGPGATIRLAPGSRWLRVEGAFSQEDVQRLQGALDAAAKALPSCDNTPGR